MLPTKMDSEQAAAALEAFANAYKKQFTLDGSVPKLPAGSFKWKEFRTPTKNLLVALTNAIQVAMPEGWTLQDCKPRPVLIPRGSQADRVALLNREKQALGLPEETYDMVMKFVYNFSSQSRWPDYTEESCYRLSMALDEGTEVRGWKNNYQNVHLPSEAFVEMNY